MSVVVVAYKILEASTKEGLEALVKEFIGKGRQPLGGIAVAGTSFYQALVGV